MTGRYAPSRLPPTPVDTPEETALLQAALRKLFFSLAPMAIRFGGTSMPEEQAEALLASLRCTLISGMRAKGLSPYQLSEAGLMAVYRAGVAALELHRGETVQLWQEVCLTAPKLESISLRDTLRGIGKALPHFDARYAANVVSCDIDYQLLLPVSEALEGLDYVSEYLHRLRIENRLLSAFPPEAEARLLNSACRGWQTLLINLCHPVLDTALALLLTCGELHSLLVTDETLQALRQRFEPMTDRLLRQAVFAGATQLTETLSLDEDTGEYAVQALLSLAPRLSEAVRAGDLLCVFAPVRAASDTGRSADRHR